MVTPPAGSPVQPPANALPGDSANPFNPVFSGSLDPFADFEQIQQQMMDSLQQTMAGQGGSLFDFDNFGFDSFGGLTSPGSGNPGKAGAVSAEPDIAIQENPDACIVTISLPKTG